MNHQSSLNDWCCAGESLTGHMIRDWWAASSWNASCDNFLNWNNSGCKSSALMYSRCCFSSHWDKKKRRQEQRFLRKLGGSLQFSVINVDWREHCWKNIRINFKTRKLLKILDKKDKFHQIWNKWIEFMIPIKADCDCRNVNSLSSAVKYVSNKKWVDWDCKWKVFH